MVTHSLPPDMVLAYKRYKQDTERVAGWLAEKSAKAGYKPNTDTATVVKEPKLKGRARKLARDAAKHSPPPPKQKYTYTVKTIEFVEMAKYVVNAQPKVILSRAMQAVWRRTIELRRQCGLWFQDQIHTDVLADEKHSHFASILEQALTTLKPCCEPTKTESSPSKKSKQAGNAAPLQEINNMFAQLEAEDILSEEEQGEESQSASVRKETNPEIPRVHIDFDDKETEAEFLFAVWSFMNDVFAVRLYVASTWQLYSIGQIELMQAASITNLAVDLVRRAEADFEVTLRRPLKYPAAKYPTGALPFLIFKLHLPAENGGALDFDVDAPATIIIWQVLLIPERQSHS